MLMESAMVTWREGWREGGKDRFVGGFWHITWREADKKEAS